MTTTTEEFDKATSHPLEEMLNIEEGTTMVPSSKRSTDMVVKAEYDEKDDEIDEQFQEVYDLALDAFEAQAQEAELVEGKYKARNGEIAAQYLNTALAAAREKSDLKQGKDKLAIAANKLKPGDVGDGKKIIADFSEILRAVQVEKEKSEPIDITPTHVEE